MAAVAGTIISWMAAPPSDQEEKRYRVPAAPFWVVAATAIVCFDPTLQV